MVDTVTITPYVEFGFRSSYAGPFECRDGNMQLAVLKGDLDLIESFVERTLNVPAGGAVEYRPLSDRVLLLYGYNLVSSAKLKDHGKIDETLVTFWIPLWQGHTRDGKFERERLCMNVPFIMVDNPLSHITGREVFGFAKALGKFTEEGERLLVDGFGGPTDPTAKAGWFRLLELGPVSGEEAVDEEIDATAALEQLAAELAGEDEGIEGLGLRQLISALIEMAQEGTPMIFLKQLRAAGDQETACYQAVIESISQTVGPVPKLHRPLRKWDVKINETASHPIGAELGVKSQTTRWSVKMTGFDFDVLPGKVLAP